MSAPFAALVLASLPRHGDLFAARRPPVTPATLDRRLALLPADFRSELDAIETVLDWAQVQAQPDDAAALAQARGVLARLTSPLLRAVVEDRLAMRSVIAAIRWRRAGRTAPASRDAWGFSPLSFRISQRWTQPGFGLGPGEAWAARVVASLGAGDTLAAERAILGEAWRRLGQVRVADPHGLEAVALYVLRWRLIDRWTRRNAQAAAERFAGWTTALADQALAGVVP